MTGRKEGERTEMSYGRCGDRRSTHPLLHLDVCMCNEAREALQDIVHHVANPKKVIVVPAVRQLRCPRAEDFHRRVEIHGDDVGRERYDPLLKEV